MSQSKLYVKKFGGTSVGSITRIELLAQQIAKAHHAGEKQVIVCSAMAGETNRLLALGQQITLEGNAREMDMLISTGEQISIALMALALQQQGLKAKSLTGDQVQIHTDDHHGHAAISHVDTAYLQQLLDDGVIPVVAGFQGRNSLGDVTTLGRGGSDTTAVALSAALNADECQIFTDVAGVFTTDPRIEPQAQQIPQISFACMHTMAEYGAKVLHPDSVAYAQKHQVALRVLSSFEQTTGTLVVDGQQAESGKIVGIAILVDQVRILFNKPSTETELLFIFSKFEHDNIRFQREINLNNSAEQVAIVVSQPQLIKVLAILDLVTQQQGLTGVHYKQELAQLTLVADGTLDHTKVTARVLEVFNALGIQVSLACDSPANLRIVLPQEHLNTAVCALHHIFELGKR